MFIFSDNKAFKTFCAENFKFDLTVSRCVPRESCGKMNVFVEEVGRRMKAKIALLCSTFRVLYPDQISCQKNYYICKDVGFFNSE